MISLNSETHKKFTSRWRAANGVRAQRVIQMIIHPRMSPERNNGLSCYYSFTIVLICCGRSRGGLLPGIVSNRFFQLSPRPGLAEDGKLTEISVLFLSRLPRLGADGRAKLNYRKLCRSKREDEKLCLSCLKRNFEWAWGRRRQALRLEIQRSTHTFFSFFFLHFHQHREFFSVI